MDAAPATTAAESQTDIPQTFPEGVTIRRVIDIVRRLPEITAEQVCLRLMEEGAVFTALQMVIVQTAAASAMETITALGEDIRAVWAAPDVTRKIAWPLSSNQQDSD